jgi:serine protease Do
MRAQLLLPLAIVAGVSTIATAQVRVAPRARTLEAPPARMFAFSNDDDPHAVIGITTAASSSMRDTLGILVSSVTSGGPAERAGIDEGSRIASINGVSLRVSPDDADDAEMSGVMQRRLTRELRKVKPGDDVELRVFNGGSTRTVHVRTVSSDELYKPVTRRTMEERPSLGFSIGSSGSRRDSLGVLVMYVNDSGPAARAGLEEGNRIAAINGVDLRVNPGDAGDDYIANAKMRRLQREISDLKVGDDVDLRVYQNGSYRTLRLRAVRASELPRRRGVFIFGDGAAGALPAIPMPPDDFDGSMIGAEVRRAIERAMEATGRSLEGVGRTLDGVGRGLNRARIQWNNDDDDNDDASTPSPSGARAGAVVSTRRPFRTALGAAGGTPPTAIATSAGTNFVYSTTAAPVVARAGSGYSYSTNDATINFAGLKLSLVDRELAGYLGEGSEAGLLVTSVPEWADGLRKGDVILRIDDRPVRTGDSAVVDFGDARSATIEILRKGERSKVAVTLPH